MATATTVLEGQIGERITELPATSENIKSVRSGVGCHDGIKGVSGNGGGSWYFYPPDPSNFSGAKGGGAGYTQ